MSRVHRDHVQVCVALFCLQTLVDFLEYVQQNVQVVHGLATKSLSTKLNENLFAQIRDQVVTPDVLEFAECLPSAVENLQKRMSELQFIFFTNRESYYEKPENQMKIHSSHFPNFRNKNPCHQERALMTDYRMVDLEGVRQQSIRGQTTKDKAGTRPLYACMRSEILDPSPLNFNDVIASGELVDRVGVEVKFRKRLFFLISLTSERNIVKLINDVHVDEDSMHVEIYRNSNNDPLEFIVDQNFQISTGTIVLVIADVGERRWQVYCDRRSV